MYMDAWVTVSMGWQLKIIKTTQMLSGLSTICVVMLSTGGDKLPAALSSYFLPARLIPSKYSLHVHHRVASLS